MDNNLEEKLGAILSDPQMMQKIQSMAQSLNLSSPAEPASSAPSSQEHTAPSIDLAMVQKLSGLAGQTGIDKNQQTLLSALSPYISQNKVAKLENAMRAAKMAKLASSFMGSGGLQHLMGR